MHTETCIFVEDEFDLWELVSPCQEDGVTSTQLTSETQTHTGKLINSRPVTCRYHLTRGGLQLHINRPTPMVGTPQLAQASPSSPLSRTRGDVSCNKFIPSGTPINARQNITTPLVAGFLDIIPWHHQLLSSNIPWGFQLHPARNRKAHQIPVCCAARFAPKAQSYPQLIPDYPPYTALIADVSLAPFIRPQRNEQQKNPSIQSCLVQVK
ncbi:hypothetical protein V8F33_003462 [Rhypophila sp. PSN 637]